MCAPGTLRYSGYMLGSGGIPVDPLKPCTAPGQTILSGRVPMHPERNTYTQGTHFASCIINERMQNA